MPSGLDGIADYELLTVPEVAELLRSSPDTVYELMRRGEIKVTQVGRKKMVKGLNLRQFIDQETAASNVTERVPGTG